MFKSYSLSPIYIFGATRGIWEVIVLLVDSFIQGRKISGDGHKKHNHGWDKYIPFSLLMKIDGMKSNTRNSYSSDIAMCRDQAIDRANVLPIGYTKAIHSDDEGTVFTQI